MKNFLLIICFVLPFFAPAQEGFYTYDMSEILTNMDRPWSVGNGIDEPYFEVIVYGGSNLNFHDLEIMNTVITVVGDTINSGLVTKRFEDVSNLIVESTLNTIIPEKLSFKMYPNPATVYVTFTGDYIQRMRVYNLSGQLVNEVEVKDYGYRITGNKLRS
jgi:hypothetical protein